LPENNLILGIDFRSRLFYYLVGSGLFRGSYRKTALPLGGCPADLFKGVQGVNMHKLDHAAKAILVKAALSAPHKSKQKSRIMKLWEVGILPAEVVENLFRLYGLKGE